MKNLFALSLLVLLALTSCTGGHKRHPLPRREAFARLNVYPAEYVRAELPVEFDVNAHIYNKVERRPDGSYWLTAIYPHYGATLYCTFSPTSSEDELNAAVANRLERMQLNTADAPISTEQYSGDNYSFTLVKTRTASATPVQFLVYPNHGEGWVSSGSVFFPGIRQGSCLDSIRPAIDAVERDIRHSIYHLTAEQ